MSCAIDTLLACFHLSGFFIDGGLIHSNAGEARIVERSITEHRIRRTFYGDIPVTNTYTELYMEDAPQNPYARIAIGYDVQWSAKWSARLDYSHESSIATGRDHGAERMTLAVTWRPFAH
jgi:hypothetical protein